MLEGDQGIIMIEKRDVPLCRPSIGQAEIDAVVETLNSGWLAHGEYNHKFEDAFADLLGVPHAISMNSCTSALEVALKVSGIKGEVIIPSFTFVATANVVVTSGGTPVFCEVDEATRNVTAETIAEKITPKTEAVIIVHYGGQPCRMAIVENLIEFLHGPGRSILGAQIIEDEQPYVAYLIKALVICAGTVRRIRRAQRV